MIGCFLYMCIYYIKVNNSSFILKNTSGSQIHLSSEETPDCSNGSTPISHLSGFVDVSELVSNGGLLVVSAAVRQI